MGLFNRKKKEKNNYENQENSAQQQHETLTLNYSSGEEADLTFLGGEMLDNKYLNKVRVTWITKDNRINGSKEVYLEPVIQTGEDGNNYDITSMYYKDPEKYGYVKGMFRKDQVESRDTDYLGGLAETGTLDQNGRKEYYRYEDKSFLSWYKNLYKNATAQEAQFQKEYRENLRRAADVRENEELASMIANADVSAYLQSEKTLSNPLRSNPLHSDTSR